MVGYLGEVALNAVFTALVLGGVTGGIYAGVAYLFGRSRPGAAGTQLASRLYRHAGAILLGVGTIVVLGMIPGLATRGLLAGTLGTALGGVLLIVLGWLTWRRHAVTST